MKYLFQERVPTSHLGRTPKTASYAFTCEKKKESPWRIKTVHRRSNGIFFLIWNLIDRRLPFWFYLEHLKCNSLSTEYRNTGHLFEGSIYFIMFTNFYLTYMAHKGFMLHTNSWIKCKFISFSPNSCTCRAMWSNLTDFVLWVTSNNLKWEVYLLFHNSGSWDGSIS